MTRPQIIRADTIDLQDKSSPTAQDHSNQPERPAPLGIGPAAPHQQASLQSVEDERNAEEARLQNAWNSAGNSLRDDSESEDERTITSNVNRQKSQQDDQILSSNNGAHADMDDDMQDADVEEDMDDDMLDKISSSPSIDDEDIDFEFVYALHTFIATVEGQANATKGDTMVLLDDSNSYWWLVRIVKDSSIGYLPAEHIETPTERLARLNKHRNIDLSATMLGDTAEKTKNPLKKAMRRRNAKTVQFGAPTYVEASDYDYSSDEDGGDLFGGPEPKQVQQQQAVQRSEVEQDSSMQVQPLKLGGIKKVSSEESRSSSEEVGKDDDKLRTSDEMFDRPLDQKVSRNGTVRNTDSFFKDENTETRKITLTPNLLRDDSSTSTTGSRERGPSLESLEKNGFADKIKDDKKKKDKKSGMLSGLFKRKDKKDKNFKGDFDSADTEAEKATEKPEQTSPQSKTAEASPESPSDEQAGQPVSKQLSKGKLQKQPRTRNDSPIKTKSILKTDSPMEAQGQPDDAVDASENVPPEQQTASTMRLVSPEEDEPAQVQSPVQERVKSPEGQSVVAAVSSKNPFRSNATTNSAPKPEKVHKAQQRVQLDDFDSSEEESDDPFADPNSQDKPKEQTVDEHTKRLSESPVHVTAADEPSTSREMAPVRDQEPDAQHPPGLTGDNSSADTSSRFSTPDLDAASPDTIVPDKLNVAATRTGKSPSPTLLPPNANLIPPPSRAAPVPLNVNTSPSVSPAPASSESTQLPAWSDASLRSYLDDGTEIRDLLLMVNDTTGVVPVGKDHPLMSGLFVEESKVAQSLSMELDRLLNGLMDNRMKRVGSGASKASKKSQISTVSSVGGR